MQSLNVLFTGKDEVVVREEPVRHPGPREVLVEARKTLISTGTEGICLGRLFEPGTHWDNWVKYPFSPGYSMVGQIVAVGQDVAGWRGLERVGVRAPHGQYAVVDAARLVPVPDNVSDEDGTWFGLANIVQNAVRRAGHEMGDAVAVIGLGLLGQLAVQYLRLMGAREVIAIDTSEARIEMARQHGATATLATPADQAVAEVKRLTGGSGADVVYDVTGNHAVFQAGLAMLRNFGKLIVLGDTGAPGRQALTSDVITRGLKVIGTHDCNQPYVLNEYVYWSHPNMARLFYTYVGRGDMRVADLVTHRFAPGQAPEAYRMLQADRSSAMGVVFDWTTI